MNWILEFGRRLLMLFRRGRFDADLAEEMRLHCELREQEQIECGLSPKEAHYAAGRRFGNDLVPREESRDMWGWNWLEDLLQDIRYGVRMLVKNPGFTVVAVLTLALGIGANTAIFSVMNTVMLRFLPVPDPERLVYLRVEGRPEGTWQTGDDSRTFNMPSFDHLRNERAVFSDLMAFAPLGISGVTVRHGEEPEVVPGDMVSGNLFSGLGVRPARGRTLTLEDETHHAQVAVLSYAYWTRRFARNPSVLGETLYVRGIPFTIVGVAERDFWGVEPGTQTDLWIPLQNRPDLAAWGHSAEDNRALWSGLWWSLMMIGRLQPGVTRAQALAQINPLFQRAAYIGSIGTRDPKERPPQIYFSSARGIEGGGEEGGSQRLLILMAMVGLVLIIACVNVAMLLVARNTARQREFSLRMAVGAGRGRLFRQLLTESLLMVAAGAALGWIFARWSSAALAGWAGLDFSVTPDKTVLFFTLAISLLAALAFGLAPLRNAVCVPLGLALKVSAATAGQERGKFRSGQVAVALQMAMCLVLMVAAGLLARTLRNLQTADVGLRASGLLVFGVTAPQTVHSDQEALRFFQALTGRLRVLPGVESATLMQNRIGSGWSNNEYAFVDGVSMKGRQPSMMRWNAVGPDFFHVLGTPILLGRDFTDADSATAAKVVIINQTFAKSYLPESSPLGHRLAIDNDSKSPQYTIIGIVADSRYTRVREHPVPMAYFPYTQVEGVTATNFELRSHGNPSGLLPEVRRVVHDFGPDLPLLQPMTQQEQFDRSFSEERLFARLSVFFGLLGALLVATGLYGTLAYKVGRRTAEIGVRMALGAERRQVLWMVFRESLYLGLAGSCIGLPLAIVSARALRSVLFGVGFLDPSTIVGAVLGIILVTLGASYLPARRATKVDPMLALRHE
jgi:predicted permease